MKIKRWTGILLAGWLALLPLTGCEAAPQEQSGGETLLVYASFYPMYDFASKIAGEKAVVVNMVPDGTEPHDWEPAAADIVGMETADVFIYNGMELEHWVPRVLASLENKNLIAVETARDIEPIAGSGNIHEGDDHGDDHDNEDPDGDASGAHHGADPHVWLDPMNAKLQMERIRDALSQADPGNAAYYEANYAQNAAALDALDQEFKVALSGLANRDIIVAHEAFGYLCQAYGLRQVGIEGLSPDAEPDPARMADIIAFARERTVKVIFFEELVSPKVAQTVAEAIGAETAVLNPLEGLSDAQRAAGDDYFSVMRQNLAALLAALG